MQKILYVIKLILLLLFFTSGNIYAQESDLIEKMMENCILQTKLTKYYDSSYVKLDYPMGDIDIERGVCTDVIIRAFRAVDIDLQKEIHEDMKANFSQYPNNWGLKKPDSNIDHRRVANIATYMKRNKKELKIPQGEKVYKPGDIVTWKLPNNSDHIGLVSDVLVEGTKRFNICHNIGNGTMLEDILFEFQITGHFRYFQDEK